MGGIGRGEIVTYYWAQRKPALYFFLLFFAALAGDFFATDFFATGFFAGLPGFAGFAPDLATAFAAAAFS